MMNVYKVALSSKEKAPMNAPYYFPDHFNSESPTLILDPEPASALPAAVITTNSEEMSIFQPEEKSIDNTDTLLLTPGF